MSEPTASRDTARSRLSPLLVLLQAEAQRQAVTALLEGDGFEVVCCADLAEALNRLSEERFAVAIVDVDLPDADGAELLARIRDLDGTLPLIVHTASGSSESARQAVAAGSHAYVELSSAPRELLRQVRRAHRQHMAIYSDALEREVALRTRELRTANEGLVREIRDREAADAAFRTSEERNRTLVDNAPICIHEMDLEGRLLTMNRAGLDLLQKRDVEEVVGICVLDVYSDADRERVGKLLENARRGEVCRYEVELTVDGERRVFSSSVAPLRDADGRVVRLMGHTEDITERRTEEARRGRLQEQLRQSQKLEAMGTLAAGVAHDFNNFLQAILGYAALLEPLGADANAGRALAGIQAAGERATQLTQSLLAFSREQAGERVPVSLGRLVTDSAEMFGRMLPAVVEVAVELPGDSADPWVEVDATQIHQVLMNLAVNARDAMPEGGQLRLVVVAADGRARLLVEDTGSGIPEDVRRRVFEPFYTTKTRGQGTGLGLAVAHGIIAEHGGSIAIEAGVTGGTRVVIELPTCEPVEAVEVPAVTTDQKAGRGELVLVVEDEPHVREVVCALLHASGYRVVEAATGPDAIAAFAAHDDIELAILDYDLPGKNGKECLIEMRRRRPELPAAMISGYHDLGAELEAMAGVQFLQKPFSLAELRALVVAVLPTGTPRGTAASTRP